MNKLKMSRHIVSLFFVLAMCTAVSAFAGSDRSSATLSGAQEIPEVNTPATGEIRVKFDKGFTKVSVIVDIKNLVGSLTGAHFHCARPAANGPVVLGLLNPGPLSFDGKRIRGTLTNTDFTGADCSGTIDRPVTNITSLAFAIQDGLIYVNIHSDAFPSGEIRGQMGKGGDDS